MIRARTLRLPLMAVAASALFFAGTAAALPLLGPSYPAPGGNTWVPTGGPSAGDTGGLNGNYGGFDSAYFVSLYWGPQWGLGPGPQAGLDGVYHSLAFAGVSGTTAIWEGITSYTSPGGPGPGSCGACAIRLAIDVSGLGATRGCSRAALPASPASPQGSAPSSTIPPARTSWPTSSSWPISAAGS